jgi:(1->4)-alpha-D-glucan 1-alpha-D-glucosylmutase
VLSELPDLWRRHVTRWSRLNRSKRKQLESGSAPTRNDEYLLYQTLVGVWSPEEPGETLLARLQAYLIKAAREAKRATSWMNPNADYEEAISTFAARLFENPDQNAFLRDFAAFAATTTYFGHLNSLAQTVLKLTSPGVPDTYQGTEVVSLALVDPDNRRPVDYEKSARMLQEIIDSCQEGSGASMLASEFTNPHSGRAKLFVTWRLLQLRRQFAEVFARGDYEPLQVSGACKDHVLAFSRTAGETTIVVMLAKWLAQLMNGELALPAGAVWADTLVGLSRESVSQWHECLTGEVIAAEPGGLRVSAAFKSLPVAVVVNQRGS